MQAIQSMDEISEQESVEYTEDNIQNAGAPSYEDDVSSQDEREYQNTDSLVRMDSKSEVDTSMSLSPRIKEMLLNELRSAPSSLRNCLEHPDQELVYFSFDTNKLLCEECISCGLYSRHQVVSFSRASDRIKKKTEELLCEIENKANLYQLWEKRMTSKKDDLNEIISTYKDQIESSMEALQRKIEEKKEALLEQAEQLKADKQNEFEIAIETFQNRQEEILNIGGIFQSNVKLLEEEDLCQYYSKRSNMIKSYLNEDNEVLKALDSRYSDSGKETQEQFNLKSFQDDLHFLTIQLSALRGVEDVKELAELASYDPKETEGDMSTRSYQKDIPMSAKYSPLQRTRVEKEQSVTSTLVDDIHNLFKNSKASSPFKPSTLKISSAQDLVARLDEKPLLSFRTRSENISRMLDKLFETKSPNRLTINTTISPSALEIKQSDWGIRSAKSQITSILDGESQIFRSGVHSKHVFTDGADIYPKSAVLPLGRTISNERKTFLTTSLVSPANSAKLLSEADYSLASPKLKVTKPSYITPKLWPANQDKKGGVKADVGLSRLERLEAALSKPDKQFGVLQGRSIHTRSNSNSGLQSQSPAKMLIARGDLLTAFLK